jgi:co-chaperonin GroES (HSP10)
MLPNREDFIKSVLEVTGRDDFSIKPTGWKILIAMPDYARATASGIMLPDEYVDREEMASPVAYVVALGESCYTDLKRFPSGPYCKAGDLVIVRPYSGTRLVWQDKKNPDLKKEFRFINDDTVEGVVTDPSNIKRIA